MDAFELLEKDHEKVSEIFDKLDETTERGVKTREDLFTQLKNELDVHSRIEEVVLYPALKEYDETRDLTLESLEEHHVVKQLLSELEAMPKSQEEWAAKLKVLKENVEHHVEEEEDELFVNARSVLTEEQIEDLGNRLAAEKKKQKAATV